MQTPKAINNLRNHLLVATRALNGTFFERAVIYMVNQGPEGAMGFVINQPLPTVRFEDIARSIGIESMLLANQDARPFAMPQVLRGGPVENNRGFVLHSPDYQLKSSIFLSPQVRLSAQTDIVTDIAKGTGPQQATFCLGYAGWGPGQLEAELHTDSWLVLPAQTDILFQTPATDRYAHANHMLGLNALNFSAQVGLA